MSLCKAFYNKSRIERKSEREGKRDFFGSLAVLVAIFAVKGNGVVEYEDYEKNLTMEQRKEREQALAEYAQEFEKAMK